MLQWVLGVANVASADLPAALESGTRRKAEEGGGTGERKEREKKKSIDGGGPARRSFSMPSQVAV